jgi:hypothetical protein
MGLVSINSFTMYYAFIYFFLYRVHIVRKQLPLQLGDATSIHKTQRLTLNSIRTGVGGILGGTGQQGCSYVALSRIKTLDSLHLISPITETITLKN